MTPRSPLFTDFQIRSFKLPNRFVLPGMQRGLSINGAPTEQLTDYYVRRVEGGVGLIVSESVAIDHPSATRSRLFCRLDADTFPAWERCIAAVRKAGGKIMLQLWHEGAFRKEEDEHGNKTGAPTISPSGLMAPGHPRGRAATAEELEGIKDAFVATALLAQRAGAHGVELHGAHGYFLDQCLWAGTNRREDAYGGPSVADRVRYPASVASAVREACGSDFIISFRLSQWKQIDLAARIADTPEEFGVIVTTLKEAGLDMLHISTRRFWESAWPGSDKTLSAWARELSGLPVITVGSVGLSADIMQTIQGVGAENRVDASIALLERGLQRGDFDLVAVGRGQLGDPDWVRKVRERRFADIIPFKREAMGELENDGEA